MEKIAFVSLGCSKNLIDTEVMLGILKDKHMGMTGHRPTLLSSIRVHLLKKLSKSLLTPLSRRVDIRLKAGARFSLSPGVSVSSIRKSC